MGTTRSCLMLTLFPGGGFGIFTDRDQQSTFWGFEFRKSVFIWVLVTAAVFFWLLNKSCISKYFIFLIVFFGSRFIHSPCASVNTVEFLIIIISCLMFAK